MDSGWRYQVPTGGVGPPQATCRGLSFRRFTLPKQLLVHQWGRLSVARRYAGTWIAPSSDAGGPTNPAHQLSGGCSASTIIENSSGHPPRRKFIGKHSPMAITFHQVEHSARAIREDQAPKNRKRVEIGSMRFHSAPNGSEGYRLKDFRELIALSRSYEQVSVTHKMLTGVFCRLNEFKESPSNRF